LSLLGFYHPILNLLGRIFEASLANTAIFMGKALSLLGKSFDSTVLGRQVSHLRVGLLFGFGLLLANSDKHGLLILVQLIYQFGFIALDLQNASIFCRKIIILCFLII
jgi:hypothetical protein